jgi:hypothetical protein
MATSDRERGLPARHAVAPRPDERRRCAIALAALVTCGFVPSAKGRVAAAGVDDVGILAATWREAGRHYAGLLAARPGGMQVIRRVPLPTRAHGVLVEAGGTVLVAARRPGDWLLRFDPSGSAPAEWCWNDGEHVLNGHAAVSIDRRRLFTTETSLHDGAGGVGVRDARTMALLARWPTGGIDPHELLVAPDGDLWVANGGIEIRPETGRTKHGLDRMDSSLVRLDGRSGRITGEWRLADRRLGIRHLALGPDGMLAAALQAEHDDDAVRAGAPVLAIWRHRAGLQAVALPPSVSLAGYGGSVTTVGDMVAVSCPRADLVAGWRLGDGDGEPRWQPPIALPEACALSRGWLAGAGAALRAAWGDSGRRPAARWALADALRLDNHWAVAAGNVPAGRSASDG